MRWLLVALVALGSLAAPRIACCQPRPSDALPEDQVGPVFDLPTPGASPSYRGPEAVMPSPPAPLAMPPSGASPIPRTITIVPEQTFAPGGTSNYGVSPQYEAPPQYSSAPPVGQLDAPPQISPNAERWRYMNYGGRWWYLQPSNHWSYWSEGRWVEYSSSRYSATAGLAPPPLPRRRLVSGLGLRPVPYVAPIPNAYPYGTYSYGGYGYGPGYYGPGVGVGVGVY
jgi:hypothetical protein